MIHLPRRGNHAVGRVVPRRVHRLQVPGAEGAHRLAGAEDRVAVGMRRPQPLGDGLALQRLPAQGQNFTAMQYVSKDKAEGVLFAFRVHMPEPARIPPIYLRGLEPAARYAIDGFDGVRSGAAWMNTGLRLELNNGESTVRRIRRVP